MEIFTQRIKQIEEGNVKKKSKLRTQLLQPKQDGNRLAVDLPLIAFTKGSSPFSPPEPRQVDRRHYTAQPPAPASIGGDMYMLARRADGRTNLLATEEAARASG